MGPFLCLLGSIVLGATGQILMKWGTMQPSFAAAGSLWMKLAQAALSGPILAGLAAYGVSAALWILALESVPLSKAYPMVAAGYVLVFLASVWLFHEPFTWARVCGLALIVAGVLVLARS